MGTVLTQKGLLMLVLKRRVGEKIICRLPDGREIVLTVTEVGVGNLWTKIGVEAPADVLVAREEIYDGLRKNKNLLDTVPARGTVPEP